MGCDIHMYVEKKFKTIDKNDQEYAVWIPAQGMIRDSYGKWNVPYSQSIYSGRNYELFGFLTAGKVRRDCGIALSQEVKGFPEDASAEVSAIFKWWCSDGHTPNYYTLKELRAFDWENGLVKESGMMHDKQWKKFKKSMDSKEETDWDLRFGYCQAYYGSEEKHYHYHEWEVPVKEAFKDFYDDVVCQLSWFDRNCDEDEIRIVFWFDN